MKTNTNINIWIDIGQLDVLLEDNQKMHALMQEKGYTVIYREFVAGHNFTAWRDEVWRGLEAMFFGEIKIRSRLKRDLIFSRNLMTRAGWHPYWSSSIVN